MSILKSHCSRSSETTHRDVANSDFGILTPFQPAVRMGRCTSSHTSLRFFLGTDLSAQLRMASKMIFDHFPAEGFLFNLSKKRSKVEGALHFLPRKHLDHNSDKKLLWRQKAHVVAEVPLSTFEFPCPSASARRPSASAPLSRILGG